MHARDREHFDDGVVVGHVAVELVPALVPLDRVELVAAEVEAASQVGSLSLLDELGNANRQI